MPFLEGSGAVLSFPLREKTTLQCCLGRGEANAQGEEKGFAPAPPALPKRGFAEIVPKILKCVASATCSDANFYARKTLVPQLEQDQVSGYRGATDKDP